MTTAAVKDAIALYRRSIKGMTGIDPVAFVSNPTDGKDSNRYNLQDGNAYSANEVADVLYELGRRIDAGERIPYFCEGAA